MAATTKSIESFRLAAKDYLNDDRFSDFSIICGGKEFKVHRCFICAHSKWFEKCCAGMFAESMNKRLELEDDLLEVVERMVTFFYTFDYNDALTTDPLPEMHSGRPLNALQLNAHVYAMAENNEVTHLKSLALEKFKLHADVTEADAMLGAAWTIYKDIQLPENDRELHDLIVDMWLLGGVELAVNIGDSTLESCMTTLPEFMTSICSRFMRGSERYLKQYCKRCKRYEETSRSDPLAEGFKCRSCDSTELKETATMSSSVVVKKYW